MNVLEKKIIDKVLLLVPRAEQIDFRATVNKSSFSMEFFEIKRGERKQCYELVDEGIIKEGDLDNCFEKIAEIIRSSDDYTQDVLFKISFSQAINGSESAENSKPPIQESSAFSQGLKYLNPMDFENYNPRRGFEFFYNLMNQGYEYARVVVYMMYISGIGVEKNMNEAKKHSEILKKQKLPMVELFLPEFERQINNNVMYEKLQLLAQNLAKNVK